LLTSPQTSGKSLMKIINNSGPRMLPCGIPLITFIHDENLLFLYREYIGGVAAPPIYSLHHKRSQAARYLAASRASIKI